MAVMDRNEPSGVTHLRDYMSPEKRDEVSSRRMTHEISGLRDEVGSVHRKLDSEGARR